MSEIKQCPFCGKPIQEEENVCEECKNHMDHQYATDFLDDERTCSISTLQTETEDAAGAAPITDELNTDDTPPPPPVEEEPKRRSKLSKGILFLIVGSVILVIIGIIGALDIAKNRDSQAAQEAFWMKCVEENTPLSYSKYLVRYPDGNFAEEAEKRIRASREAEVKAWEELRKSSDLNAFYAYLGENPNTPHIEQIHQLMDSLSWNATLKDNTADAYKAYIENANLGNIAGDHKDEAKQKYDYLSQIVILSGASLENVKIDLEDFLKKLSENKPKELLKEFPSKAFYFTTEMSSTEIVASISKKYADEKIKKITYTLNPESLTAKQDNQGIIFIEATVEKEIDYDIKKKKNDKVTQKLALEIGGDKLVKSIKSKK